MSCFIDVMRFRVCDSRVDWLAGGASTTTIVPTSGGGFRRLVQLQPLHASHALFQLGAVTRVCIVDSADDMNRNAANALLKTLEEPPKRGILILISHSPGRLPATIRSRCRKLVLNKLDDLACIGSNIALDSAQCSLQRHPPHLPSLGSRPPDGAARAPGAGVLAAQVPKCGTTSMTVSARPRCARSVRLKKAIWWCMPNMVSGAMKGW